jgi:hypothetical protein
MPETESEPWEYSLCIPSDRRAVTVCRRTLRLVLTVHGLIGVADTAELLAAELVANAAHQGAGDAPGAVVGGGAAGRRVGRGPRTP